MGENGGNIVNIVLISSMGMAGQSHSAAAREAVKNLSMTLGTEWASKECSQSKSLLFLLSLFFKNFKTTNENFVKIKKSVIESFFREFK